MRNKILRQSLVLIGIGLIGGCFAEANEGNYKCSDFSPTVTPSERYEQLITINPKSGTSVSVEVSNNAPIARTFEAKQLQSLSYFYEEKNVCIKVRNPATGKFLDDTQLGLLPISGKYTLELYSLQGTQRFNLNIKLVDSLAFTIPDYLEKEAIYEFDQHQNINNFNSLIQTVKIKKQEAEKNQKNESQTTLANILNSETEIIKSFLVVINLPKDFNFNLAITKIGNERHQLINAIYMYQRRTSSLYRDDNGDIKSNLDNIINGKFNSETRDAIVNEMIFPSPHDNTFVPSPQPNSRETKKKQAENIINEYYLNLQDKKCERNWEMLSDDTKQDYNNQEMEYIQWCYSIDNITIPNVKFNKFNPNESIVATIYLESLKMENWQQPQKNLQITICLPEPETFDQNSKLTIIQSGKCKNH